MIQDKVLSGEARKVILHLEGILRIKGYISLTRVCKFV